MRSTADSRVRILAVVMAGALGLALVGCGAEGAPTSADPAASTTSVAPVPRVEEVGTRAHEYTALTDLAAVSSALVIARTTGRQSEVPLPEEQGGTKDSAPIPYVEMRIEQVLSGTIPEEVVDVVTPGDDLNTGESALLHDGSFLMYLTPAMYTADQPAGGYVVAGTPAGLYARTGATTYAKVDIDNAALPETIDTESMRLPEITKTAEELLAEGPK